ncbi:putative lipid II flippase FtsW [Sphaerotilus montanus]|jgi:cell division protein FtsW|uniref:Probable peptidoglycan glycosyltransferase FtsW n=1 Tax=Sphaerotilus montanus TaxID=522889 RepID=A0A7Y9U714_9BURK|nr:putative lipid II flippase FtsW [Sphaerotilus montanus]NYG33312.1 cell division protein FtsW [Sphaerotilus montanus]NZD57458.1 putative lipid II flippase FtsW [Sphaerotilus montanus]
MSANARGRLGDWWSRRTRADVPVRNWTAISSGTPTRWVGFDETLAWVIAGLLSLGLVMVYSASIQLPDNPKYVNYTSSYFLMRHILSITLAIVAACATLAIPMRTWEKMAPWLFVAALLLLVMVLIPGIGRVVNRSRRWIPLGVMNFQPSELAKLAMAMYAANYMVRKMDVKESFTRAVLPMAIALGVIGLLLLAEPDMGAFIVIALIAVGILFLGGVNGKVFAIMIATLLGALLSIIWLSPIRWERIKAFWNPWDEANAMGKAYQLTHSLIAFGRGEVFGQGLGQSVEKLHYLPEAHTDFLLAIIGEELGLIGVLAVILAFFWMVRRIFIIGRQAIALDRVFSGLTTQGIGLWVGGQSFINMGVNLGVLPTKGLTLPLLSYGGSAIILTCVALAVVLRVDMENRQILRGGGSRER